MTAIKTLNAIKAIHIASQISALKLEGKGIRFRKSVLAHCKKEHKLKGNRESIIQQLIDKKEALLK